MVSPGSNRGGGSRDVYGGLRDLCGACASNKTFGYGIKWSVKT